MVLSAYARLGAQRSLTNLQRAASIRIKTSPLSSIAQNFRPSKKAQLYLLNAAAAVGGVVWYGTEYYNDGMKKDFYDYRFITTQDPDDLAGFYGSEQFMDIFCVVPFMGTLMMRGGQFDEEGTVHTTGFPGELQVSMVFSDNADDDGNIQWFNKRERFRDVIFGYTCWDMVTNFGFERLDDERVMVYHHGEYFQSKLTPFSWIARMVFKVHARWVAWATEHHLNHYAFKNKTEFDEHLEEESRTDMPLFLLKNYAWSDLMGGLFGREVEMPSFLILKSKQAAEAEGSSSDDEEEDDIGEEEAAALVDDLPVHRPSIQRQITADIKLDRRNSNLAMMSATDQDELSEGGEEDEGTTETKEEKPQKTSEMIPINEALHRTLTLTRHVTTIISEKATDQPVPTTNAKPISLERENLGGHPAWEAVRATNNPMAYKAATIVASQRRTLRRATLKRKETQEFYEAAKQEQQNEEGESVATSNPP